MTTNPPATPTIAPPVAAMAVWRVVVDIGAARLVYRVAAMSKRMARRKVSTHRAQAGQPWARTLEVTYLHPAPAIDHEA